MARLLAPGVLSTPADEVGASFSPDGRTVFFGLRTPSTTQPRYVICEAHYESGTWTPPEVASFSGLYDDTGPRLSPDGQQLVFASLRPVEGSKVRDDFDLWVTERQAGGSWGPPRHLPDPINTAASESSASVAADGTLYFSSDREGGKGGSDIYFARRQGEGWSPPENLGEAVNTAFLETQPFISPDQTLLFFVSAGRPEIPLTGGYPYVRADIYVSQFRGGVWSPARSLGPKVNAPATESQPTLSPDGKMLLFSSERGFSHVPMPRPLSYDQLQEELRSTLNGGANIYAIEIDALGLGTGTGERNH